MKYGIYKSKNGIEVFVSRDFFHDKIYYVTYADVPFVTLQKRITQVNFEVWLKRQGYKYAGVV